MKYPKLREIKEAVNSIFSAPYTTSFPGKPHVPFENFRGKPVVDEKECVGCETCANVCPSAAITIQNDIASKTRLIRRDYGKCIFCGQCETYCITGKGVKLSNTIYDLATFNRDELIEIQEKELIYCSNCMGVIATKDHLSFLHKKLGAKAFSSILNLNILNERLKLADTEVVEIDIQDELKRKDMFNFICPNCRRKILIRES